MRKTSWICRSLIGVLCLLGIGYAIPVLIAGNFYEVGIRLSIILTALVPSLLRKLFHVQITPTVEIIYLLFIFFGHFLGSIVGVYNMFSGYDKIVHTFSGILTSCIALILLKNMGKYQSQAVFFNIVFMIVFTLGIACFWEFFEFICDTLFEADAQHVLTTGVTDTMLDMLVAFIGSIIVSVLYGYEIVKKKKGMIYHLVEE